MNAMQTRQRSRAMIRLEHQTVPPRRRGHAGNIDRLAWKNLGRELVEPWSRKRPRRAKMILIDSQPDFTDPVGKQVPMCGVMEHDLDQASQLVEKGIATPTWKKVLFSPFRLFGMKIQ